MTRTETTTVYEMWLAYWLDGQTLAQLARQYHYANRSSISRKFSQLGLPTRARKAASHPECWN